MACRQTVESFNRTLDIVLSLQPDRLAVFSCARVPQVKPAQKSWSRNAADSRSEAGTAENGDRALTEQHVTSISGWTTARPADELAVAQKTKTTQHVFGVITRGGGGHYAFSMLLFRRSRCHWQNRKFASKCAARAGRFGRARLRRQ
jgi:oxygen-independent coproporphyrinogen-3 oxidase